MAGPKDSFDPLLYLERADSTVAGSYEAPERAGADSAKPSVLRYSGDPTSNLVGETTTKHNTEVPRGGGGQSTSIPDKFDPINLTPGTKHPYAPASTAERYKDTGGTAG